MSTPNDLPSVGTDDARRLADEIEPLTRKCRPDNLTQGVAARALRLLAAERDELASRVRELELDAKRWGLASKSRNFGINSWSPNGQFACYGEFAERLVDAALSASKEQP